MDFNKQTNTPKQRKSRENENETVHKGKKMEILNDKSKCNGRK